MSELTIAIPLGLACVVIAGFCSGTEVALFSLRRVDREQLANSELAADRRILRALERPRRLIATVLIGNQAFHSILAVAILDVVLTWAPFHSQLANAGLALAIALPPILLLSEVTAKTVAAKAPLAWARIASLPIGLLSLVATPVRWVLSLASEVVLRPLGASARTRPARDLSEEEFRTLVDAGSAQGQVDARERRLIHRVFEFSDKNVGQVMTPRDRIFAVSYDVPVQRLAKEIAARGFSRVPVYQKSLDNIRGIVHAKDLVRAVATGQPLGRPLGELLHEPLFVPRTTPVKRLFLTFKQKKVHMAMIVSEYGKVLGLVTMDDLLAQIFGHMRDERAELQNSIPPGRLRVRTPGAGAPVASAAPSWTDPDATGPVHREEDSGPIPRPSHPEPDSGPAERSSGIIVADELTPPAVELAELTKARPPGPGEDNRN